MATTVFDLLARVSADVSPFSSAMDTSAGSVDSSLASIYQSASRWLGAGGVAGVFYKATSAANEFNQVIADISAITELQIRQVEQSILRLDNVFGKPVHTASTFYETISSGIRGSTEDISQYVEAVGKAATTIRADIENTGNVMTTLTNAYDLATTDTQKLLDFLYLTVREGKAHGDELARTLGLVINNAAESKVSLEELGAAIAVLSRTQSASQSMIGLNQMLNSFIKPTLQAQAEARKWNIELGASSLQAKGLTASLQELHDKVGGNVEALEKMFGNIRAGRAILALTGNQFDNFIEVLDAFKQGAGAGEEAFSKQIDTAYKDLTRLRSQVDKTLIQIGKDIEPVTRAMYGLSESVLKGFGDASPFSRYASYIYIVIAAVQALRRELTALTAALAKVAGTTPGAPPTGLMASILGTGGALSKLYNGMFAVVAGWSVADIGYNIGKAIADRYNFTDSSFIRALADALNFVGGSGDGSSSIARERELEQYNIATSRRNANATVERLLSSGQISTYQAEKSKAAIAGAKTQQELDSINTNLRTTYGAAAERETTRQLTLRNAKAREDELRKRAERIRQQGYSSSIIGKGSTAFYSELQSVEDKFAQFSNLVERFKDLNDTTRFMAKDQLYAAFPAEFRQFMGDSSTDAYINIDKFARAGGIGGALTSLKKMMGDAVKSGDFTSLNKILNTSGVESLKSTDIGKDLNDIQLKVLDYVIQSINKSVKSSYDGSAASNFTYSLLDSTNRELKKAVSDRVGAEYNFYVSDLIKRTKVDQKASGADRARQLLDTSVSSQANISYTNLEYAIRSMEASYDRLSGMVDAFDRNKAYLEPGRISSINEDLTAEGGRFDAIRKQVQQNTLEYVDSVVKEAEHMAYKVMESANLDSSVETATALDIKVRMQEIVLSSLDKEINALNKELSNPEMSTIRKNAIRLQLKEFMTRRDSASAEFYNARKEREDYQLQYMSRLTNAGMMSSSTYEKEVRAIYSGRITQANKELRQLTELSNRSYVSKLRIQQAEEAVQKAMLEAAEATQMFGKTQSNLNNALMSQVQDFASEKQANGNLTQNAIYHGLNLLSRLYGPSVSTSMVQQPSYEVRSTPNYKNAQNAQSAIARSLDAYIMSQKHAQASVGETVLDIYNYIRQNKAVVLKG